MLTELQKQTCQAIVNIFETSRIHGDYGLVTVHPEDPGHLTYGRSQTTLASGNLALLVRAYCGEPGAQLKDSLLRYLPRLEAIDLSLDHDRDLHGLLREAGGDPAMRAAQDAFFDRVYWAPAQRSAERLGAGTALATAVVYDSHVHGSWVAMRERTVAEHGALAAVGEKAWIGHYLDVRRRWLAGHSNSLLRRTVYRMDALGALVSDGRWDLALPLTVRSVRIDEAALVPTVRVSAEVAEARLLMLRLPFMRGEDVRALQQALADRGLDLAPDGVFGGDTDKAVRAFQERAGLSVDGKVGAATRAALDLD